MDSQTRLTIRLLAIACLGLATVGWNDSLRAQFNLQEASPADEETDAPAQPASPPGPNDALVLEQQRIADQFKHLEEVLLRMAETSAATDPRRAAFLRRAVAQSKERLIGSQFETLIALLNKDQLSRALESQKAVDQDLRALLDLLLSEDRGRRLESEKARMREYLKRVDAILKQQKSLQGRTAGGAEMAPLAQPQAELAQQAGGLAQEIKTNEEAGEPSEQKPGKTPPSEPKPSEQRPAPGKGDRPDGDRQKPSEGKPQEGAQPSESQQDPSQPNGKQKDDKSQPGQPQQGSPDAGQDQAEPQPPDKNAQTPPPADQGNPARQRLDKAQQRMREAQEQLKQAQRDGAVEKQEEAIRELEQAKAELEEILRQLREEERGRMLTLLEARFRKMLEMQRDVYEGTVRLDKVPQADRTHSHDIEAGRLSGKESEIVLEADKALNLMREDGTAVAFPEAVGQMREDMQQVVQRLAQSKVDRMTQGIEEDILAALEEMVEALKKAQKDLEDKKQQPPPPSQAEQQDPALVDGLAELKMIRALQMRVNSRTERYSRMITGEQATDAEVLDALKRLAERQQRIYRVTHDLEQGRNQ